MTSSFKSRVHALLRWSEKYTKTDMVYLASGGFWLIIGQIGMILLSLATAIAFGHLASQDTYGNYKYVLALAGLFSAFSLSGIGTAVTQSVAKGYDGVLRQGFRLSLSWSWGVVLVSLAAAVYYQFIQHNSFLGVSLVIVAGLCPFLNSFSLFDSFLVGKKDFARDTQYSLINAFFPVAAVIAALFLTQRAIIIIIVYFIANAISDAVVYLLTLRTTKNLAEDPDILTYSGHLSVMSIINAIADKIDAIAIFSFLGPVELAIYAFAIAIPEQLKFFSRLIAPLSLPRFAERPFVEIKLSITKRIMAFAALLAAIAVLYIFSAPWIFAVFFPRYTDAVTYSDWYVVSIVFVAVIVPITSALQAHRRTRELYIYSILSSTAIIILLPLLTFLYGLPGAILSQIAYRIISAAVLAWEFYRSP